jgi:hypothetical protein
MDLKRDLLSRRILRTRKKKLIAVPGIVQLFYIPVNIHQKFPQLSLQVKQFYFGYTLLHRDADAAGSDYLDPEDMERIVADLGRTLRQRTTLYEMM